MQPGIPQSRLSELLTACTMGETLWIVDVPTQVVYRQAPSGWERTPVSTSKYGLGQTPDSNCTPTGWHRITEIIGTGAPLEQEFISRKPVPPSQHEDRILTRILWLAGQEPHNANTHSRYIYFHGTNQEHLLGTPASQGCIRMANTVIAEWADTLKDARPQVWIGQLLDPPQLST